MPKSAFQPARKPPSKQDSQDAFFSSVRKKEQPFFQTSNSDTIQAQLEPETVSAAMEMEDEEASGSMEQEEEATGGMDAPQEEEAQPEASA